MDRGDKKRWVVVNEITFEIGEVGSGIAITAPAGQLTDLASIPRILHPWSSPFGSWTAAAVLHDRVYSTHCFVNGERVPADRKSCDDMFLEAMLVAGVRKTRAYTMYFAVRIFGAYAYQASFNKNRVVEL